MAKRLEHRDQVTPERTIEKAQRVVGSLWVQAGSLETRPLGGQFGFKVLKNNRRD